MEGDRIVVGAWDVLIVTADIRDNLDELGVFVDLVLVGVVERWPRAGNKHAVGPAEALPDCFGDEWREWMKHDEELLEGLLDERRVLPELFTFDKPVSVAVPDEIVDKIASFSRKKTGRKRMWHFEVIGR